MITLKQHIIKGTCAVKFCTKTTKHGRTLCDTCMTRKWRKDNPVQSAYLNLKHNAKRRNVICTITPDQFAFWCSKVIYIGHSGRAAESWTIDRKYNDIGYHIDNIRAQKKGDNTRKYFSYDWRTRKAYYYFAEEQPDDDIENVF